MSSPDLKAAIGVVERLGLAPFVRIQAAMPKSYLGPAYGRWNQQRRESEQLIAGALRGAGVNVWSTADLVHVAFAGVSSTSTMGLSAALKNWKTAAQKRLNGGSR